VEKNLNLNHAQIPILIVEDDGFFRSVVRNVLNNIGFQNITEADSGRSACALFHKKSFQLILSDVQMPFMNGLQLLQHIRSGLTPAPRDTRVIILTSFSNTEVLGVALALDVNGFRVKPIKPNDVLTKINGALSEIMHLRPELAYKSINANPGLLTTTKSSSEVLPESVPSAPKQSATIPSSSTTPNTNQKMKNIKQVPILELQPGAHLPGEVVNAARPTA